MIRTALRRISARRLEETSLYQYRQRQFLLAHPYCQVWLAEHGVAEEVALRQGGRVSLDGAIVSLPLATEIHHKNKRRGADLLDTSCWLAACQDAHRRIEENKVWARAEGFLLDF